MSVGNILLIAKAVTEELEKLIAEAQNEQADTVHKQHCLNIARAKANTLRKYMEDAENLDISESKRIEKDLVELEVLRKIQHGEKK